MRILNIIIDAGGHVKSDGFAGFEGEHNSLKIVAQYEEALPEADYFRMIFSTTSGNSTVASGELLPSGSAVSYTLPAAVTSLGDTVLWQLCAYGMEGEEVQLISKTDTIMLTFGNSLPDNVTVVDPSIASTVEAAAAQVEDFLNGFGISATTISTPSAKPKLSVSKSGYRYTVALAVPEDYIQNVTTESDDYNANELYGNRFDPPANSYEELVFSKTANVVTVCGVVKYNQSGNRGHTATNVDVEVLYLPYTPLKRSDVFLYDSTAANGSGLYCRLMNSTRAVMIISGTPLQGHNYRMTFSYVCES